MSERKAYLLRIDPEGNAVWLKESQERLSQHATSRRIFVDGVEMLYLMTFCLPRFQNQPFEDKLVTLFHELYHIGPAFDGDLRRHAGRYAVHSGSQRRYDRPAS